MSNSKDINYLLKYHANNIETDTWYLRYRPIQEKQDYKYRVIITYEKVGKKKFVNNG